jgi:tryptophan-rich sensory protein
MERGFFSLPVFLIACLATGFAGALFTASSVNTWYAGLEKPAFTPPNWLFAPVWTTLYVLMGISGWLVWRKRRELDVRITLVLFAIQLLLNLLWSLIFFGLRLPAWAFLEIIILWLAIALYAAAALRISKAASLLFLPYLAWVGFAAVLNYFLWMLN